MSTSSAVPDDLELFGTTERHRAESLLLLAGDLDRSQQWFARTCGPDAVASVVGVDLADQLRSVARRLLVLADDTSLVARAFRRADAACHPDPTTPVTVTDMALEQALHTSDPIAGLVADLRRADVRTRRRLLEAVDPRTSDELVTHHPTWVGNTAGVPWRLRVAANHRSVQAALRRAERSHAPTLVALFRRLLTARLLVFDPIRKRIAVVHGDLDTARSVGIFVPGMGSTFEGFLDGADGTDNKARAIYAEAARGAPRHAAVISWLGYDAPPGLSGLDAGPIRAALAADAENGGRLLVAFADGLGVRPDQRLVLVGHSYGTVVIGEAFKRGLHCSDVIFAGSPGVGYRRATQLQDRVDGAVAVLAAPADAVAHLGAFGTAPDLPSFGALRLATNAPGRTPVHAHSHYFDPHTQSLANIAALLVGKPVRRVAPSSLDRVVDHADGAAAALFLPATILHTATEHYTGPGATPLRAADEATRIEEALPGWGIRAGKGLADRVADDH